jgi:penicillin-binding protein 1C
MREKQHIYSSFWQFIKRKWLRLFLLLVLGILVGVAHNVFKNLPSIDSLPEKMSQPSVRIEDRNGRLLYEIIPGEGRHAVLSVTDIPQCMKDATIAVEDKNFYQNPGVDIQGILRAVWINVRGGQTVAGGSTITQQVARNLLLSDEERFERSLRRKMREAVLAWQLTRRYSKDEILALYLNQIYYGGLAYGVEAGSQTFFGKPASDLLLPECALLAGLPQAPGLYNPFTNPELAKDRQVIVLGLMEGQGFITDEEQLAAAVSAPLSYNTEPYPIESPHFVWIVKSQLDRLFTDGRLDLHQSLVVRTTLDLDYQHVAEAVLTRHVQGFQAAEGAFDPNVNNAALVVLDPHTGDILALVGSADYFNLSIHGAVDMATAPRQTGSAFKPFIYAQALDPNRPLPWTPATVIYDVSTTFITQDGKPYTPANYDGQEHGPVSVREALGSSLNIPAVLALQDVGIEETLDFAAQLGVTSLENPQDYDLSLALGGGKISLLELSSAYATFASGGLYRGNYAILDVQTPGGELLYLQEKTPPLQIIDSRVAWLINDILSDDTARVTGFGHNSTLKIDRTAAVKTGTTTNYHDNWTIGYTPDLLVGVWVGNSNYEPMRGVTGLTGAAPIWHETLRAILQGQPDHPFERPAGLTQVEVCALSGSLPTSACQHTRMEWLISGTGPTQTDTIYQEVYIDTLTGLLANDSTPSYRRQPVIALDLPVEALPWARSQGMLTLADLSQGTTSSMLQEEILLLSPRLNATYRIDPIFDLTAQQLLVEAIAGQGIINVELWADGNLLATFGAPPYQTWWPLSVGEHRFWAQGDTSDGNTVISEAIWINVVVGE